MALPAASRTVGCCAGRQLTGNDAPEQCDEARSVNSVHRLPRHARVLQARRLELRLGLLVLPLRVDVYALRDVYDGGMQSRYDPAPVTAGDRRAAGRARRGRYGVNGRRLARVARRIARS